MAIAWQNFKAVPEVCIKLTFILELSADSCINLIASFIDRLGEVRRGSWVQQLGLCQKLHIGFEEKDERYQVGCRCPHADRGNSIEETC